jgi:hypothetical protein
MPSLLTDALQSSQTKATEAPSFYTDYLTNLASQGKTAACQAQFIGAQPLQTQAFQKACQNFGQYQPAFQTGQQYVGQAAGQNIAGAATPYLQAGTSASPLCAARPMICQAAGLNLGCVASTYMSPYIKSAVQSMSDIAQRNIRQNLSPMATAAAVGSGQFGSQRGAQVLGQVQQQAQQDLNSQIAQMLNTGYGQALGAAQTKQQALGNLAQQVAEAQKAQNLANLTAAQTAGCAAAREAQARTAAGQAMGTLGQQAAAANLACINALATLGGQQQSILQNEQNYPLAKLQTLSSLLQGYQVPTSVKTTLCMSPFSALGAIGTGALGAMEKFPQFSSGVQNIFSGIGNLFGGSKSGTPIDFGAGTDRFLSDVGSAIGFANGGLIGATPAIGSGCCSCCSSMYARGGNVTAGSMGCHSTRSRGALPYKKG